MDFEQILVEAAKNQKKNEKMNNSVNMLKTQLSAPKKEKKDFSSKSEVVRKLIEEKEASKRAKEEEEARRIKEEEKNKIFKIPKKGQQKDNSQENPKIKSSSNSDVKKKSIVSSNENNKIVENKNKRTETVSTDEKKKLSENEKDRIRKEFEEKVARLKKNIAQQREERQELMNEGSGAHKKKPQSVDKIEVKDSSKLSDIEKRMQVDESHKKQKELLNKKDKVSEHRSHKHHKHKHKHKHSHKTSSSEKKEKNHSKRNHVEQATMIGSKKDAKMKSLSSKSTDSKPEKKKIVRPMNGNRLPPAMNFLDILKLAQEKSKEPIPFVPTSKPEKKKEEEKRPLTQEEKERAAREQLQKVKAVSEKSERKLEGPVNMSKNIVKSGSKPEGAKISKSTNAGGSSKSVSGLHSRKNNVDDLFSNCDIKLSKTVANGVNSSQKIVSSKSTSSLSNSGSVASQSSKCEKVAFKKTEGKPASSLSTSNLPKSSSSVSVRKNDGTKTISKEGLERKRKLESSQSSSDVSFKKKKPPVVGEKKYDKVNENILVCGPAKPKDTMMAAREQDKLTSSNPWDRITSQFQKKKPKPVKRRIEEDSEEDEYEDDDFIDDGEENFDYSSHIKEIFGYDKSKYRYESDYDIANMESNFREVMKEEARSARLGLQEDLEDMRKEEEELRRKALKKARR